jgi:hypothetical protein
MTSTLMRVLLDNGVFSHSEFSEGAVMQTAVHWGDSDLVLPVQGLVRKAPQKNAEYQSQVEALFTVGRLIREGRIEAYDYSEILFERMRPRTEVQAYNALQGCTIHRCPPAVERSRFRGSMNFIDTISKGGKNDQKKSVKKGVTLGDANQIAFFKWLCTLRKEHVGALISQAALIGLTAFEIESLKNVEWFQFLCERSESSENYPDVFHLWTAERNGFDALLTLDGKLQNLVSRVRNEKVRRVEIKTKVVRPQDLLPKLGIDKPDPVPMDANRFYRWRVE